MTRVGSQRHRNKKLKVLSPDLPYGLGINMNVIYDSQSQY